MAETRTPIVLRLNKVSEPDNTYAAFVYAGKEQIVSYGLVEYGLYGRTLRTQNSGLKPSLSLIGRR